MRDVLYKKGMVIKEEIKKEKMNNEKEEYNWYQDNYFQY